MFNHKVLTLIMPLAVLSISLPCYAQTLPEIDCLIEPNLTVEVSSPVAGVIDTIYVDRSDTVTKGQLLASLISDVEEEAYKMAQVKAQYLGNLESSKVNLKLSEKEHRRSDELYKERAIPLNEKDQADANLELAKYELDKAIHEKQVLELELNNAKANLELRNIRSPIDGVVADRYMSPGEFVETKPVLKLSQLNPLRIEVISPIAHFGKIKTGMHAYVIPEFGEYEQLIAEVKVVDKVIDAASGTFGVRLMLDNEDYTVPGGLKCKLRFFDQQQESAYQPQSEKAALPMQVPVNQPALDESLVTHTEADAQCVSLGPVRSQQVLDEIASRLGKIASQASIRQQQLPGQLYMVQTAASGDPEQVAAQLATLKAAGIKDIAAIKQGDNQRISLGVYRDEATAKRRQEAISALGQASEIRSKATATTQYWLDISFTNAAAGAESLQQIIANSTKPGLASQACPAAP